MSSYEKDFRKFLAEAELGQYVNGGQVTLFHYTNHPADSLVLRVPTPGESLRLPRHLEFFSIRTQSNVKHSLEQVSHFLAPK